jgi:hypothetical protein
MVRRIAVICVVAVLLTPPCGMLSHSLVHLVLQQYTHTHATDGVAHDHRHDHQHEEQHEMVCVGSVPAVVPHSTRLTQPMAGPDSLVRWSTLQDNSTEAQSQMWIAYRRSPPRICVSHEQQVSPHLIHGPPYV